MDEMFPNQSFHFPQITPERIRIQGIPGEFGGDGVGFFGITGAALRGAAEAPNAPKFLFLASFPPQLPHPAGIYSSQNSMFSKPQNSTGKADPETQHFIPSPFPLN